MDIHTGWLVAFLKKQVISYIANYLYTAQTLTLSKTTRIELPYSLYLYKYEVTLRLIHMTEYNTALTESCTK